MNKKQYREAIIKEIEKLNVRIDKKILTNQSNKSFRSDAVRHKKLINQLKTLV
jgi:hypothetical protein